MINIRVFTHHHDNHAESSLYVVFEGKSNFNVIPKKIKANTIDLKYNFTWNLFTPKKNILEFNILVIRDIIAHDIEYLVLNDEEFALFLLKFG